METILIVGSFIMLVLLVYVLIKGFNPALSLTAIGLVAIFIMQYVNKASILEVSTGSYFFDTFSYAKDVILEQFGIVVINVIVVMGYVTYLDHLNANNVFATILGSSVKKLKSRNIIIAAAIIITVAIKWVVPSAITTFLLLLSTVYPVLRTVGCSKVTSITSILLTGSFPLGPNQFFTGMLFGGYAGMEDVTAPEWFLTAEIPVIIPTVIVAIIVFIISTNYFEKKENRVEDNSDIEEVKDPREYGVPMYYGMYPIIPLILVMLFGGTFKAIKLVVPVIPIYLFCTGFVLFIEVIRKLKVKGGAKDAINEFDVFLNGMGTAFGRFGTIAFAGAIFADGLSQIGGMSLLMDKLTASGDVSGATIVIIACLASFLVCALSGNIGVGLYPIAAIFGTLIAGGIVDPWMAFTPFVSVSAMGTTLALASGPNLIAAEKAEVPVTTLIKRMIPALTVAAITMVVASIIRF